MGRKKVEVGHHFCVHEKGWVKKSHAKNWRWVMNNYAKILLIADTPNCNKVVIEKSKKPNRN